MYSVGMAAAELERRLRLANPDLRRRSHFLFRGQWLVRLRSHADHRLDGCIAPPRGLFLAVAVVSLGRGLVCHPAYIRRRVQIANMAGLPRHANYCEHRKGRCVPKRDIGALLTLFVI